jgi:two-component system, chemotaxis family, chemotaxis protein CheY
MFGTPSFRDVSVLVVDEGNYPRKLIREMLARAGLRRVTEAPDGAEALAALSDVRPEIVILDWNLPILSGEEFIRLTRTPSTSPSPTIPIILTLSNPYKYIIEKALMLGVNEVLVKPFSPKDLWSRFDEALNKERTFVKTPSGLMRPMPRKTIESKAA